jgi:hypothetical protein
MARKKPARVKSFGTNVLDYPSNMSQYEKESRAAEAKLSQNKKKRKAKLK